MATDMAIGDADAGTALPTTTGRLHTLAPSTSALCARMQRTAHASGAGVGVGATGVGVTAVGAGVGVTAAGAGVMAAGAGVGVAGSHQVARPGTRSALLPAAKILWPTKRSQYRS